MPKAPSSICLVMSWNCRASMTWSRLATHFEADRGEAARKLLGGDGRGDERLHGLSRRGYAADEPPR